jgi:hypothetical protein
MRVTMAQIKKPRLLIVLLMLVLAQGVMYLVFAGLQGRALITLEDLPAGWMEHNQSTPTSIWSLVLMVATWGVLGAASLLLLAALRRGRTWAWTLTLIVEGAIQVLALQAYFSGQHNALFFAAMALAIAITLLLNQRQIQYYFLANRRAALENRAG